MSSRGHPAGFRSERSPAGVPAGACGGLSFWCLTTLPLHFSWGAQELKGGGVLFHTKKRQFWGVSWGRGREQKVATALLILTPFSQCEWASQYVRSINLLSWYFTIHFISSVPSSVPIIPVSLPGVGIMLRTACILENYLFTLKSSWFTDVKSCAWYAFSYTRCILPLSIKKGLLLTGSTTCQFCFPDSPGLGPMSTLGFQHLTFSGFWSRDLPAPRCYGNSWFLSENL